MTSKSDPAPQRDAGTMDLEPIKAHLPPLGFWSSRHERTIHDLIAEIERLRALVPSSQPETPTEEDEGLHTGDDERLDLLTQIISDAESALEDSDPALDMGAVVNYILEDANKLDVLLVATIKRERAALPVVQDEAPKAGEELAGRWLKASMLARGVSELDSQPVFERCVRRILGSCSGHTLFERLVEFVTLLGASRPSPADRKETL